MSLPNIFRRRLLGLALAVASAAALLAQQSGTHALPSAPADPNAPSASAFSFRAPPSGGAAFSRYMSADALALDPQGNVFVTGFTGVPDLPGVGNAFQRAPNGVGDAYVMKFDPSGRVLWSTYLGGNDRRRLGSLSLGDFPTAIAVDPQGQVTLVGDTGSTGFPTTSSAVLPLPLAVIGADGFVAKFSADGSRLLYSTYLGAPDAPSTVRGVAAGPSGDTWVAVNSTARIATRFDLSGGTGGIVIVKLNPSGTPVWSTRVPGRELHAFTVDASGDVYYATGCCASPADPQVSRLDAAGMHFVYRAALPLGISSFLVTDLAIGPDGSALAVALSGETTIPTPRPLDAPPLPFPDFARSGDDALVGIFDAGGRFSTLGTLAGRSDEAMGRLAKVAVGPAGFAIGFDTLSGDLPGVRPWVADHVDGPLFISTDRGDTWSRAAEKTLSAPIEHLAVESPSNMLHAATRSGLYLSIDNGATWTQERAGPHTIVAINPRDPRERYISDGLVVSRHDRGQAEGTLLLRAQFPGSIRVIAVNPLDNSIWVSGNFGVDVSYDGGRTWMSRRSGLPDDRATGRVVSPDVMSSIRNGPSAFTSARRLASMRLTMGDVHGGISPQASAS